MEIHELLDLIEVHGRAPGGEHSGPVATIASALVQRLGVQCERYRALIVARTSTSEWRFLLEVGIAR
jgi:hypothetical protein